jgi:hypothetical protein
MKNFGTLVEAVDRIDPEAAYWLQTKLASSRGYAGPNQWGNEEVVVLNQLFDWMDSPLGYPGWQEIQDKLIEVGYCEED